jgi:hypothetical protein
MVDSKELRVYSTLETDFWTSDSDPMVSTISQGTVDSADGLGNSYSHIQRITSENLRLSGYLETEAGYRSTITGSTSLDQISNIDIFNKRPTSLVSQVNYDISVQAFSGSNFKYVSSERIWTYPSLVEEFSELSIEDISEEREISIDDSGTTKWGSYQLEWEAVEYERIMDIVSLRLDLRADVSTMQRLSISELSLSVWIGDGIPQIMKMLMNISSERYVQTPYILDYLQEMIDRQDGDTSIIFGDIQYQHETPDKISDFYPEMEMEFHSDWEYVPKYGSLFCSIPQDFTAEDSINMFTDNANYRNFERTKTDPFALYTNFTYVLDKDQWRFSVGDSGEDRCWNQTVYRETTPPGLTSRIDPVMVTREDIGTILTYSGSEVAIKKLLSEVNKEGANAIFGVSTIPVDRSIDFQRFAIGTEADMDNPMLGFVNPTLGEKITYGLFIESLDGTIEIALDMTTGQLSYVKLIS